MSELPNRLHQKIVSELHYRIRDYIGRKGGSCEVYPAPFAVFLNADDRTCVEPDLTVVCDLEKLDARGCNGAPDWVIEVISPGTQRRDYDIKLFKYRSAGVREYWIINPLTRTVNVYDMEHGGEDAGELSNSGQYSFDEAVTSSVFPELTITVASLPGI